MSKFVYMDIEEGKPQLIINIERLKDVVWKLEKQLDEIGKVAASRKELLKEIKQFLDVIYAEDIISSGDLGKVYEKIVQELGDA